jgi:hypothetical protein
MSRKQDHGKGAAPKAAPKSHDAPGDLNRTEAGFHPAPRAEDTGKFAGDGFDVTTGTPEGFEPSPTVEKGGVHEQVPVGTPD